MLEPLPYHRAVRDHLEAHVAAAWTHFDSDAYHAAHADDLNLALLKATYRLEPQTHAPLHAAAQHAANTLGLEVPIHLFQGEDRGGINAALYFTPDAARVVLHGPVEERLEQDELHALFGHELAHHLLWTADRGGIFTSMRVLEALADQSRSALETLRLHQLATEVFADRGALASGGSLEAAVRLVIKAKTNMRAVDVGAFMAQAEEVLQLDPAGSAGWTHPEHFIRAKAMALYLDEGQDADADIARLLEGKLHIDAIDLLRRPMMMELSRDLVDVLLEPGWFRSEAAVGHARLMFDDHFAGYEPRSPARSIDQLAAVLGDFGPSVLDYLGYLVLDFVAVDPSLDDLPLAQALDVADALGLLDRVERFVNKELKIAKKTIKSIHAQRKMLLDAASKEPA